MLIHAEAMQVLVRERQQEAARRAELTRLETESLRTSESTVRSTVYSALRPRPRPATRPAMLPMRPVWAHGDPSPMRTDPGVVDELVLRLKGLVQMRVLLERSGAPPAEIEKRTAEINRVRASLARLVQESAEDYGSAA